MVRVEVADKVMPFPSLRQSIITEAELQGQARRHVPVVHRINRWGLVHIVADRLAILLLVVLGQTEQSIDDAVANHAIRRSRLDLAARLGLVAGELMTAGVAAKAVLTIGVAEELLVLGVAVVAEAELHGMFAHGVRNIRLGLKVLGGVVPGSRSHLLAGSVRSAEAAHVRNLVGSSVIEERANASSLRA